MIAKLVLTIGACAGAALVVLGIVLLMAAGSTAPAAAIAAVVCLLFFGMSLTVVCSALVVMYAFWTWDRSVNPREYEGKRFRDFLSGEEV